MRKNSVAGTALRLISVKSHWRHRLIFGTAACTGGRCVLQGATRPDVAGYDCVYLVGSKVGRKRKFTTCPLVPGGAGPIISQCGASPGLAEPVEWRVPCP